MKNIGIITMIVLLGACSNVSEKTDEEKIAYSCPKRTRILAENGQQFLRKADSNSC